MHRIFSVEDVYLIRCEALLFCTEIISGGDSYLSPTKKPEIVSDIEISISQ